MNKIILAVFLSFSAHAQIRDFQTTRLTSTAGAGVASILSTEAGILNPATSAFFEDSGASYHRMTTDLKNKNSLRTTTPRKFPKDNLSQGFFVSDHSGPVKGGVTYTTQDENDYERERASLHGAASISPSSSMGFSYRYTRDKMPNYFNRRHDTFHQVVVGLLKVINEKFTLGLVAVDPTRTNPGDERVIAGFQYTLTDKITFIGDWGYKYTKSYNEDYSWAGALQVNLFSDFFVRAGRFYDNISDFKGMGWGASWLGPRLGIEFAQKTSDHFGKNTGYIYRDETLIDTSLSAVIKF